MPLKGFRAPWGAEVQVSGSQGGEATLGWGGGMVMSEVGRMPDVQKVGGRRAQGKGLPG